MKPEVLARQKVFSDDATRNQGASLHPQAQVSSALKVKEIPGVSPRAQLSRKEPVKLVSLRATTIGAKGSPHWHSFIRSA